MVEQYHKKGRTGGSNHTFAAWLGVMSECDKIWNGKLCAVNFNEDIMAPILFIKPQATVLVPTAVDFGGPSFIIEGRWTRGKKHRLGLFGHLPLKRSTSQNGWRSDPSSNDLAQKTSLIDVVRLPLQLGKG